MRKRTSAHRVLAAAVICLTGACASPLHENVFAPVPAAPPVERATLPLPNCIPAMDSADHWLSDHPQPDRLLLTQGQIRLLNRDVMQKKLINDVFSARDWIHRFRETTQDEENPNGGNGGNPENNNQYNGYLKGLTLETYLKKETGRIRRVQRFDETGRPIPTEVFDALDRNLNLEGIRASNPIRYGITRERADIRYYPTDRSMTSRGREHDFDILEVSSILPLQPVAIFHTSRDGAWEFVAAPYCRGWLRRDHVISSIDPKPIQEYLQPTRRLTIIGREVEGYRESGNSKTAFKLYMGNSVPLVDKGNLEYQVALPETDEQGALVFRAAYLPRESAVVEGFQPCTPRVILNQVFSLMHEPYAWGGKDGLRDCSQMIQDVYATTGLYLPRNSSAQIQVGQGRIRIRPDTTLARRRQLLARAGAPSLLYFPGHIMLYIGSEQGRDYVIHDIWSFRRPENGAGDRQVIIGKVVVSDLSLGEGSSKGSLFERLTSINPLRP